jgi:DDE superfamily endonuclease
LHAAEQDRPDVARARKAWRRKRWKVKLRKLVFIDETSTKTNMVRLRGRSGRGRRLVDKTPHGHWKTSTFIAALRHNRLTAPFTIDGAVNGEVFLAYVRRVLVPTLKKGDIVVMDNLGSHKIPGIELPTRSRIATSVIPSESNFVARTRASARSTSWSTATGPVPWVTR